MGGRSNSCHLTADLWARRLASAFVWMRDVPMVGTVVFDLEAGP
jgi:hypothetical protein